MLIIFNFAILNHCIKNSFKFRFINLRIVILFTSENLLNSHKDNRNRK